MKSVKIIMVCFSVALMSACGSHKTNDDTGGTVTVPSFSEFTRSLFAKSANSEPNSVEAGVDFNFKAGDNSTDFSDLIQ